MARSLRAMTRSPATRSRRPLATHGRPPASAASQPSSSANRQAASPARRAIGFATLALATATVVLLAGCGSSKPSYCQKQSELKSSVQALGEVNVVSGGTSAVTSALQKVESSATGLVEAAKSEFPKQIEAIESSISALKTTAGELSSSPTNTSAIAKVPGEVTALGTAVSEFASASKSKCE